MLRPHQISTGSTKRRSRRIYSFFIAARLDQKWTNLTDRIGESAGQLIDSTVGSTFDEFLATRPATPVTKNTIPEADDLLSGSAAADPALEPTPVPAPRYTIHFHGCADEPIANEIAAVVYAVSESLAQALPLDRIDGVTFASDYPAALRDLDRGFLASAPLQPPSRSMGSVSRWPRSSCAMGYAKRVLSCAAKSATH